MFEGYKKVEQTVDSIISSSERIIRDLDPADEYEGVLRMLIKHKALDELANRCAMLMLEGIEDEDLRELFGDDAYEKGEEIYDHMHHLWMERHKQVA